MTGVLSFKPFFTSGKRLNDKTPVTKGSHWHCTPELELTITIDYFHKPLNSKKKDSFIR